MVGMDPAAKRAAVAASEAVMLTSGASGRVNALLSLRALRRLILFLHAVLLVILFPFRWRPRSPPFPGTAAGDERREGSKKAGAVVVRVPAAMVPRRQREQDAAARRAAAVRRVVAAWEEGRRGRDFSLFVTARGDTLFTQSWTPVTIKTK